MAEWAETITDQRVRDAVLDHTIITGGCIPSMLLGEKVNDFDIYFDDYTTTFMVAQYYVDKFNKDNGRQYHVETEKDRVRIVVKSAGIASENKDIPNYQYFEGTDPESGQATEYVDAVVKAKHELEDDKKPPYRPVFLSDNAITLANDVQIIIRFYGPADEIHKNYDFIHCTCFWDSDTNHLELPRDALESLITKELRYSGSLYPLCSIIRTRKFIKRNWHINAGQYLKMCLQLNELDLTDYEVLKEQLTGVDIAYFVEVLECIKDKKDINATYLIEIIDRIF